MSITLLSPILMILINSVETLILMFDVDKNTTFFPILSSLDIIYIVLISQGKLLPKAISDGGTMNVLEKS